MGAGVGKGGGIHNLDGEEADRKSLLGIPGRARVFVQTLMKTVSLSVRFSICTTS